MIDDKILVCNIVTEENGNSLDILAKKLFPIILNLGKLGVTSIGVSRGCISIMFPSSIQTKLITFLLDARLKIVDLVEFSV